MPQPATKARTPELKNALLAGGATALATLAFDALSDQALKMFFAGSAISLFLDWSRAARPLPRKGRRQITFNSPAGQRKIFLEYQIPSIATRLFQKNLPQPAIPAPAIFNQFIFHANGIELLETDVKLFLTAAWRNRARGKGLSARRWVRHATRRPDWYQPLGPAWYYALLSLLRDAQRLSKRQLVVRIGHQQYALKYDHHTTYAILKWVERLK